MKKLLASSMALFALLSSVPALAAQAESSKFTVTIPAFESVATPEDIIIALSPSDTFTQSGTMTLSGRANYFWKLNLHRGDREHNPVSIILQFRGGELTTYKDVPLSASPAALCTGSRGHVSVEDLQFRVKMNGNSLSHDYCCDVMFTLTTQE